MQELVFQPQLKHVIIEVDRIIFQHEAIIPYTTPMITLVQVITLAPIINPITLTTLPIVSDDDDDQKGLISSFRKLLEKNKSVKILERNLGEVLERMQMTIKKEITKIDMQRKAKEIVKAIYVKFTTLCDIALD